MARRWSVTVLVILGLSLAINFFMFGFFAAANHGHHHGSRIDHYADIAGVGGAPKALRQRVEDALRGHRKQTREALEAVHKARDEVRDAMRSEPFDRAKLDAAFATLRQQVDRLQVLIYAEVGDAIAASPAAERAKIGPPNHRH